MIAGMPTRRHHRDVSADRRLSAALPLEPDRQWRLWGLFGTGLIVMGLYLWLYRVYRHMA